jgi:hypothetical protein
MALVGRHRCEPPKILSDGGSNEFILGPREARSRIRKTPVL